MKRRGLSPSTVDALALGMIPVLLFVGYLIGLAEGISVGRQECEQARLREQAAALSQK